MNCQAIVHRPIEVTFGHLANPLQMGDWLPEITGLGDPLDDARETFRLTIALGAIHQERAGTGGSATAEGELTAFEPPWLVGYRLFIGRQIVALRITCTAHTGATHVRLHQSGDIELAVDLSRLAHLLEQS
jgi:hypothetical protein